MGTEVDWEQLEAAVHIFENLGAQADLDAAHQLQTKLDL
jgi:phosphoribosylcarboxyaminoimidazole (NCAIR) mutase